MNRFRRTINWLNGFNTALANTVPGRLLVLGVAILSIHVLYTAESGKDKMFAVLAFLVFAPDMIRTLKRLGKRKRA